ncbi:hypothetical protein LTR78_008127 [Recurvomyces mirabilis]|uniref:Uncharacterized protein n=1 Tax=Recurvomyces mirabilis TaxID=574656 RepID=A0AAE0TRG9_9PEZI|nr:hypothetical protein LTR78_008127 [Recurvomyces mirabilis]KAK5150672.1 hypothetical protein LTS14_009955 [Recurvomyces mirabilis]
MARYDGMLDATAKLRMCNARVLAAAGGLHVLACPGSEDGDSAGGGQGRLNEATKIRLQGWSDCAEAWQNLHDAHTGLAEPLEAFTRGTEKDLLPPSSVNAVTMFLNAVRALESALQKRQIRTQKDIGTGIKSTTTGVRTSTDASPSKGVPPVPTVNEQRHLDDISGFYEKHASHARRRSLPTKRGADGLSVQERYKAAQRELKNYYPRPAPTPLGSDDQRLQQELWQKYDKAHEALGDSWDAFLKSRDRREYWRQAKKFFETHPEGTEDDVAQGMRTMMINYYDRLVAAEQTYRDCRNRALPLGGDIKEEEPATSSMIDVDIDVGPFPQHRDDGLSGSAGFNANKGRMKLRLMASINLWRFEVIEGASETGERYTDVANEENVDLGLDSIPPNTRIEGDTLARSAVKSKVLKKCHRDCQVLRETLLATDITQ